MDVLSLVALVIAEASYEVVEGFFKPAKAFSCCPLLEVPPRPYMMAATPDVWFMVGNQGVDARAAFAPRLHMSYGPWIIAGMQLEVQSKQKLTL